jgi:hypothetical protein
MNPKPPRIAFSTNGTTRLAARPIRRHTRLGIFRLYIVLIAFVIVTIVYLDIAAYLFVLNDRLLPKYVYYLLVLLALPLMLTGLRGRNPFLIPPFTLWAGGFILLNTIHLLVAWSENDVARAELIGTRIQYLLMTVLFTFCLCAVPTRQLERMFPVLALIISIFNLVDFFIPGTFYAIGTEGTVHGRAAGTFLNSNNAGEGALITTVFALAILPPQHRLPLLLLLGTGLVVTFSRAGLFGWCLLCVYLLVRRELPKYAIALPLVAAVALPVLYGDLTNYLEARDDLSGSLGNLLERLAFFQDRSFDDFSSKEREEVLELGLQMFVNNPTFGGGAGATYFWVHRASTHNQILLLAAEYGIFGIGFWAWLILVLWRGSFFENKGFQLLVVGLVAYTSMFTHNMFDHSYWLLTLSLVAGNRRV